MSLSALYMMFLLQKFTGKEPKMADFRAVADSCAEMYRCRRDFLNQEDGIWL